MALIAFDPKLKHVLGFRHGPRARRPVDGDVWDFDCGLSPDAVGAARRVVKTYFPTLVPVALRCSPLRRSRMTLRLLWPDLWAQIVEDTRLGIEQGQEDRWKAIDVPGSYDWPLQRMIDSAPDVVNESGRSFLAAAGDTAAILRPGDVGAMCSHSPFADMATIFARQQLGITENDGRLPENFQSGAFIHLKYDQGCNLTGCDYYPVPPAEAAAA